MQLRQGFLLQGGKYRIERMLGQGGFSITYLAEQPMLERKVCIKEFFFKDYCERDESTSHVTLTTKSNQELVERFRKKFLKEARVISKLRHNHIVQIHDIFEENDTAYYVMDYIEGESLGALIKRVGSLPEQQALAYIREVASALTYIHFRSINHLDIKPSNIMLRREDQRLLLIDFGVSKQYDESTFEGTTTTPVGISHGYSPAEQYRRNGVQSFSPQSDVYALAATLYKLLTGVTPPEAIEVQDEGLPLEPLQSKHVSSTTIAAIVQAMKSRTQRTQSIESFVASLSDPDEATFVVEPILEKQPEPIVVPSDPEPQKGSSRRPTPALPEPSHPKKYILTAVVAVIAVAAVVGGFILFSRGLDNPVETAEQLYKKGSYYYDQKDYSEAVKWFSKAANQGHAYAQCNLGICYYNGWGVSQDYSEAVKWYRKAADQGHADAQYGLGYYYEKGQGVSQDYSEAVKWYRKAADQGDADAQCNLGVCYYNGWGVSKDYSEAVQWFLKAAGQGDASAQRNLGVFYLNGWGVSQDCSEAVKWYRKSADQGDVGALNNLGFCYYYGQGVSQDYSEAVKWFRKSADQGDADAQCNLGSCYYYGQGVSQDYSEAAKWYRKAADQGHADAQKQLESLKDKLR